MKDQTKIILDKQLKKNRHLLFYAVVAFIILTNIIYIVFSPATTTTVTGVAVKASTFDTDTSSITKMNVLFDNGEYVSVEIPGQDFFKNQARVELTKSVSVMGKINYEFTEYNK
jgi:hypothetical protein